MRFFFRWIVILGLLLSLTGCPPPFIVRHYNNSGVDIPVYLANNIVWAWKSGMILRIENESVSLEGQVERADLWELYWREPQRRLLQIGFAGRDVVFDFRYGPGEEYDASPIAGLQLNFQLEPDGRMYAVRGGQEFPAESLQPQPDGFPIVPYTPHSD